MDDRTYFQKLKEWEAEWCHQIPRHVGETFKSMAKYKKPLTVKNLLASLAMNDATHLVTRAAEDLARRFGY